MRSLKSECLDRVIFFGEHFHHERNHQGLGNRIIDAGTEVGRTQGEVQCRERLGGLLRYYYGNA